ncbi:ComEC/Rec2 family competence protein [Pontibacter harenae]|uniref:ComEC/Rec2 family competence protein n=1 Tax=Pontibacter harenae TaxID=2894083 RepID=UPI001E394C44|nr:ComEC/Rec2 family competence protein [Pontibacter harenae]MCC9167844.1 ComEC family competence protein [Pontibacter harenae]
MLRWAPFPIVRIVLCFIVGIVMYLHWGSIFRYVPEYTAFFITAFLVAAILANRYKTAVAVNVAGIVGLLSFFSLGAFITEYRTENQQPQHLNNLTDAPTHYVGVVADYVLQKSSYQTTVLEVQQVKLQGKWQKAAGRVQLSVPHDSELEYELSYGDVLLVKGAPQEVAPPANPNQFNYKQYLASKHIHHRHYLQSFQYQKIVSDPPNTILYYSIQLRRKLDALLKANVAEQREYSIASALILGVKDELDNSIRSAYASTGTMHVLAVSGLHVGLIYGVLMFFLGRLGKGKKQRVLSAILVLSLLWLYAFITGLSPSVMRAVLMLSLVTVGTAFSRRANIYNTIAFAALVLLFYDPYSLLDVGFQLSFLAVLGIVYLQPRFYKLLNVDNWLLDKIWGLFTVAVAAQLATLPLGLLYFHQFPTYFWFANLVVVPLATLVLYSGVIAIAFSWVPGISWLLFKVHFGFTGGMNWINLAIQKLPLALINGIDITRVQAVLLYTFLLALILFLAVKKLRYLSIAVAIVSVLSVQQIRETVQQQHQRTLTVYSLRGSTALAFMEGQEAVLLTDSVLWQDSDNYSFNVQPHLWYKGIQQPQWQVLHNSITNSKINHALLPDSNSLYVWQQKRLLVLQKPLQIEAPTPLHLDYVLLTSNVKVKPEELQQFKAKLLLLDASNSPWYRERMHQQLDNLGIAYYDVAEKGAFVEELR